MKKASPIGTSSRAQSSSGSSKPSSQTTRLPVGRSSGSPERCAQQVAQTQRIRRSPRCSRCSCSAGISTPQTSQRSSARRSRCRAALAGRRRVRLRIPRSPVIMLVRLRAATASSMARPLPLIAPAPPSPPPPPRRAAAPVPGGASRRRASARRAAGSSAARSSGRPACPRRARRPRSSPRSSGRSQVGEQRSLDLGHHDRRAPDLDPASARPRPARRARRSARAIRRTPAAPESPSRRSTRRPARPAAACR